MGLTINYQLTAPADCDAARALELIRFMRRPAQGFKYPGPSEIHNTVLRRITPDYAFELDKSRPAARPIGEMPADLDLERLYDEHVQPLYAFLLNLTRDEADTRDLLQEIFVKLARHPHLLDGVREERAFLIRLAHNAAIDLMRRRGTRDRTRENFAAELNSPFAPADDPDEATFRNELSAALAELPPDQRAVAHLKLWAGLTFEQIAAALEIPANTAASRYRYALDKMRDRLRPLYEELK